MRLARSGGDCNGRRSAAHFSLDKARQSRGSQCVTPRRSAPVTSKTNPGPGTTPKSGLRAARHEATEQRQRDDQAGSAVQLCSACSLAAASSSMSSEQLEQPRRAGSSPCRRTGAKHARSPKPSEPSRRSFVQARQSSRCFARNPWRTGTVACGLVVVTDRKVRVRRPESA